MILIALTGSIGMGKSTTAQLFVDEGCAFYDADAVVHRLYAKGGAAVEPIARFAPDAIDHHSVHRDKLAKILGKDEKKWRALEKIVHPLVQADRALFLEEQRLHQTQFVVMDIPLLFETGADAHCDYTVVVSTDKAEQRRRILARPHMTEAKLQNILARQMPDAEKRARAHFVVDSSHGIDAARAQVRKILQEIANLSKISLK